MFNQVYGAPADNGLIPPPSATFPNEAEQYSDLIGNLTIRQPVVLILGDATNWPHAVVAWGAGTIGNGNLAGNVAVYLYDSNFPQTTTEAIINPTTDSFSYDHNNRYLENGLTFSRFYVLNVASTLVTSITISGQLSPIVSSTGSILAPDDNGIPSWWTNWLDLSVPGYYIVIASTMVNIDSNGLKDYFTAPGNSQTFVKGISGSSGIEEGGFQVYAIPEDTGFSVKDPGSDQSTMLITRVDNESGHLVGYGYLLNATSAQGDLNYTVTPTASGLIINAGKDTLNANVTFFTATEQNCSFSQASNIQVGALQTANFTVSNWQTLNDTGIQITPEFPPGALGIVLTLSAVLFVTLVTVVRRRKIGHSQEARSS